MILKLLQIFGAFWVFSSSLTLYQLLMSGPRGGYLQRTPADKEEVSYMAMLLLAGTTMLNGFGLLLWQKWVLMTLWLLVGLQLLLAQTVNADGEARYTAFWVSVIVATFATLTAIVL